ncbi:hypothetical protein GCM10010341_03310 [Streptomyces noursei]|nr:hypothetical protein GCM10010341_03310 [Streptomyces noursei]
MAVRASGRDEPVVAVRASGRDEGSGKHPSIKHGAAAARRHPEDQAAYIERCSAGSSPTTMLWEPAARRLGSPLRSVGVPRQSGARGSGRGERPWSSR